MGQNFDLTALYQDIHQRAARGERALFKLTPELLSPLRTSLMASSGRNQALFILAHASHSERELEETFMKITPETLSSEEAVWLLNCYRKHIIHARFKDGDRLTHEFLARMREWLFHHDKAVVEWVLRTIDECSSQGIVFRPDLAKIKPSIWSLWRAESRTLLELITYLERKWSP